MASQTKQFSKDGLVIISMLKESGISSYEPRVVNQLLEFATRYVSCVLDDARAFANHSKKKTIDLEDIKLAVGMQTEKVFTTPPPRDLLLEVARSKNNIPLPIVKAHCGIRLPPDRYCFSACNYRLKSTSKKLPEKMKYNVNTSSGINQINTNNGPPMKMTKTSGLPTATITGGATPTGIPVKRNTGNNVARSQAITAVAKPIIKLTTNPLSSQQSAHAKINVNTGSSSTIIQSQVSSQHTQQQTSHQVEVKLEPDNTTSMAVGDQLAAAGIKRKRDEEFGGLE